MGVLGKDLFDWQRSHTHTKIQFGQSTYWIEDEPAAHHYGEVLVEVLNYDATVYLQACAALRKAFQTYIVRAIFFSALVSPLSLQCGAGTHVPNRHGQSCG